METDMLTRKTHARIYQGELSRHDYARLRVLASHRDMPVRELILEALKDCLNGWPGWSLLDIERVLTGDNNVRLYLWIPYDNYEELCREIKKKGFYVQELALRAIREYDAKGDFD